MVIIQIIPTSRTNGTWKNLYKGKTFEMFIRNDLGILLYNLYFSDQRKQVNNLRKKSLINYKHSKWFWFSSSVLLI